MTLDLATLQDSSDGERRLAALAVLAQQARELVDAVVLTDVDEDEIVAVTSGLVALTERLNAVRRSAPLPHEIGPDGTHRHLANAVSGACNPNALPLEPEMLPGGGVRAEVEFRPSHEGPPQTVHGGMSAMILDHLLGNAAAASGRAGVTGTLTLRYRRRVPYGQPLMSTAEVSRVEGRKTWAEGRISAPDGTVLVEATGLFITPSTWTDSRLPLQAAQPPSPPEPGSAEAG
jgi:acyl-coenzyme A thioesterase PaaI-like protein